MQAAASQNGLALEYASPRSPGIISIRAIFLELAEKKCSTRWWFQMLEIFLPLQIGEDGSNFFRSYFSDGLKLNHQLVKLEVRVLILMNSWPLTALTIHFSYQRLREKTETVLAALGQNPDAIQHVMPSVRPIQLVECQLNLGSDYII